MNTFLPWPSFSKSLRELDSKRLVKQVLETQQMLTIIENKKGAWSRHPAVLMWIGYESTLALYGLTAAKEYTRRYGKIHACEKNIRPHFKNSKVRMPWWFGIDEFHKSHRCNLLRKDRLFYRRYRPGHRPDDPYWWPVKLKNGVLIRNETSSA